MYGCMWMCVYTCEQKNKESGQITIRQKKRRRKAKITNKEYQKQNAWNSCKLAGGWHRATDNATEFLSIVFPIIEYTIESFSMELLMWQDNCVGILHTTYTHI